MKKLFFKIVKKIDWGSALAVRLTHLTGKASTPTHPKHLVDFGQLYYLRSLKKNDTVLDLGSHSGEHALKAARRVKKVIGLDINHQLVVQAQVNAKKLKLTNAQFQVHNLEEKLAFPQNSFTKVFLFAVLEHLANRDQILTEIRRVLIPKGKLLLSVPNKDTSWKKLQRSVGLRGFSDLDHKLEFSKQEIINLLKKHKFRTTKVKTTAIDTPLAGLIDLAGGFSLRFYKLLMDWRIRRGQQYPGDTVGFLITATNA